MEQFKRVFGLLSGLFALLSIVGLVKHGMDVDLVAPFQSVLDLYRSTISVVFDPLGEWLDQLLATFLPGWHLTSHWADVMVVLLATTRAWVTAVHIFRNAALAGEGQNIYKFRLNNYFVDWIVRFLFLLIMSYNTIIYNTSEQYTDLLGIVSTTLLVAVAIIMAVQYVKYSTEYKNSIKLRKYIKTILFLHNDDDSYFSDDAEEYKNEEMKRQSKELSTDVRILLFLNLLLYVLGAAAFFAANAGLAYLGVG